MKILKMAYFIDNAKAYIIDKYSDIIEVSHAHLHWIIEYYDLNSGITSRFKNDFGEDLDWDKDWETVTEYVKDFMEEERIFCVVADTVNKKVFVRPNMSNVPSSSQMKALSDWAIENGYSEDITVDIVVAMNDNWYKLSKEAEHNYSWVYVELPKDICVLMKNFGDQIDPEDLFDGEGDGGRENNFHITVKYGLLTNCHLKLRETLDECKKGSAYLGSSSIFEGDKYDVVKITVESEALGLLHTELNKLQHEDKHPEYHPHATIAYVKSGKGKKYKGKFKLNKKFTFDEVFFDNKKKDYKIKLSKDTLSWYK